MANTYLTRTTNTSGASRTTWTWSGWIKRSSLSGQQDLFSAYASDNDYMNVRFFEADENIQFRVLIGGNFAARKYTTRKFRDISAWYHLVIVWDTTNSSASQRMRIYVNGVQETSFTTSANPSSGLQGQINASGSMQIGAKNGADFFNGSMSHVHFADGQALAPSIFGETDSTTGEWKIKPAPSFTLGTNGFTILKDGNTITDQSANSNNFSLGGGTITATKDCPDNNFATLNPLDVSLPSTFTLQYGNLENLTMTDTDVSGNHTYGRAFSTLQVASGKFYAEMKWVNTGGAGMVGVTSRSGVITSQHAYLGKENEDWRYYHDGTKMNNNSSSSYGDSQANGDIVGVALDLDNLKIYFSKNGTWQNSGNPASGSTGTGAAFTLTAPNLTSNGSYKFGIGTQGGQNVKGTWNFGNGYFGTTAITTNSGNGYAGAEGASKFNYQPPSGYSALNTKGLNQ